MHRKSANKHIMLLKFGLYCKITEKNALKVGAGGILYTELYGSTLHPPVAKPKKAI